MCLIVEPNAQMRIADHDITVYKVLIGRYMDREDAFQKYYSAYLEFHYVLGQIYQDERFRLFSWQEATQSNNAMHYISCADDQDCDYVKAVYGTIAGDTPLRFVFEGFHAAKTINRMMYQLNNRALFYGQCRLMAKCSIPKGSCYIEGVTDLVASDSLRVDQIYTKQQLLQLKPDETLFLDQCF